MNDGGHRRRVERLLSGERYTRDLDALFLWLRFRSFGNWAISDLGNFVAHADERDQGVTWQSVHMMANVVGFHFGPSRVRSTGPVTVRLRTDQMKAAALATMNLEDAATIRRRSGLGMRKAKAALKAALDKVVAINGTQIEVFHALTETERRVLQEYATRVGGWGAQLTDAALIEQFFKCLVKNKLVDESERHRVEDLRVFLALYAVERMHGCRIALPDRRSATLFADISTKASEGDLQVDVMLDTGTGHSDQALLISFPLFQTQCSAVEHCTEEALKAKADKGWFQLTLELDASGRLQVL